MDKEEMYDYCYNCLQGWVVNEYDIHGHDLVIFCEVYTATQHARNPAYYLGFERMMQWTGLSENGVKRRVDALVKMKILTWVNTEYGPCLAPLRLVGDC